MFKLNSYYFLCATKVKKKWRFKYKINFVYANFRN